MVANYIEAQSASSKKDFINFFTHSLKSANESKFWLALLRDTKKSPEKEISILLDELTEISNILASSILKMKGKRESFIIFHFDFLLLNCFTSRINEKFKIFKHCSVSISHSLIVLSLEQLIILLSDNLANIET